MVKPSRTRRERRDDGVNYKGVRMRKWGKWVAEIRKPNSRNRIWLGSYNTAEEAARAYDAALFCLRGPSVNLNFPTNPPEIPDSGELTSSQIQEAAFRHARRAPEEPQGEAVMKGIVGPDFAEELRPQEVVDSAGGGSSSYGAFSTSECLLSHQESGVEDMSSDFYESSDLWTF